MSLVCGNIFGIIEFFKSEFAVCSANNFLSFGACGKLYLALAALALLYWSLYGKWWKEAEAKYPQTLKENKKEEDSKKNNSENENWFEHIYWRNQ